MNKKTIKNEWNKELVLLIYKVNKPLAKLKKKKKNQIDKIRNKRSYNGHHRNTEENTVILWKTLCYQVYYLEEMDKF